MTQPGEQEPAAPVFPEMLTQYGITPDALRAVGLDPTDPLVRHAVMVGSMMTAAAIQAQPAQEVRVVVQQPAAQEAEPTPEPEPAAAVETERSPEEVLNTLFELPMAVEYIKTNGMGWVYARDEDVELFDRINRGALVNASPSADRLDRMSKIEPEGRLSAVRTPRYRPVISLLAIEAKDDDVILPHSAYTGRPLPEDIADGAPFALDYYMRAIAGQGIRFRAVITKEIAAQLHTVLTDTPNALQTRIRAYAAGQLTIYDKRIEADSGNEHAVAWAGALKEFLREFDDMGRYFSERNDGLGLYRKGVPRTDDGFSRLSVDR